MADHSEAFSREENTREQYASVMMGTEHQSLVNMRSSAVVPSPFLVDPESAQAGDCVGQPRPVDVLGTRMPSWRRHPGNLLYRELVDRCSARKMDQGELVRAATRIVDIITVDRKGNFLKQDDEAPGERWYVLSRVQSISKVVIALKDNYSKHNPTHPKKIPKREKHKPTAKNPKSAPQLAAVLKTERPSSPPPKVEKTYQALPGPSKPIYPYALELLTYVSNQRHPRDSFRVLDLPLPDQGEESPYERDMRLQLRHRYIAAMGAGMSPIELSRKLLELWGGSLVGRRSKNPSRPKAKSMDKQKEIPKSSVRTAALAGEAQIGEAVHPKQQVVNDYVTQQVTSAAVATVKDELKEVEILSISSGSVSNSPVASKATLGSERLHAKPSLLEGAQPPHLKMEIFETFL